MSSSPPLNISSRGFVSSMIAISMRPICGRRLPFIESATALIAASAFAGAGGKALVAITWVGFENDAMAGLPLLEAIRAAADRMIHRAAARIRVFFDHLAGHGA